VIILGILLLIVGLGIAIHGPSDPEYAEDWGMWIIGVIAGAFGLRIIVTSIVDIVLNWK